MAEYLRPGVYVQEANTGTRPIESGSTSTAGFVGIAPRGPVGVATLCTSWGDYVDKFAYGLGSPFLSNAYLSYSVYGFFNNGGTRLYVVRCTDGTDTKATKTVSTSGGSPTLLATFSALESGTWGNDISITITTGTVASTYNVVVKYKTVQVSKYEGVSLSSTSSKFIENIINGADRYISVTVATSGTIDASVLGTTLAFTGGTNGTTSIGPANYTGSKGLEAFNEVESVNILAIPESQAQATVTAGISYVDVTRSDAIFITDGALTDTVSTIQTFRDNFSSTNTALYYPWIEVADPISSANVKTKFVPVCGHVAGIIARIDNNRGTHKAPAGIEAVVNGALSTKVVIKDGDQDVLNPSSINTIRSFSSTGIVVWGARMLTSDKTNLYVGVRRELLKIKNAIKTGTVWAVFEPNNETLWTQLTVSVKDYLLGEFRAGAFKGATPAEGFYVKCDGEINTASEVNAGRVNIEIGVAINKPAEFVVIRIGHWDRSI